MYKILYVFQFPLYYPESIDYAHEHCIFMIIHKGYSSEFTFKLLLLVNIFAQLPLYSSELLRDENGSKKLGNFLSSFKKLQAFFR